MNAFLAWALARLSEPSTYAGIAGIVAGMTFLPNADLSVAGKIIATAGVVIPSIIAVVTAEGNVQPPTKAS